MQKAFWILLVLCVVVVVPVSLMLTGRPFETTLLKYGAEPGLGVVHTAEFVVLIEEPPRDDAGSHPVNIRGYHGVIPAFWEGYPEGGSTHSFRKYDPKSGIAHLHYFDTDIYLKNECREMSIHGQTVPLSADQDFVLVKSDKSVAKLSPDEVFDCRKSLPHWYQDGELNAKPPPAMAAPAPREARP